MAKQVLNQSEPQDDAWSGHLAGSYLTGLEMAQILAELQQDQESIVAAILYRSVREDKLKLDTVENQFGPTIST